jgi:hypothetical protein
MPTGVYNLRGSRSNSNRATPTKQSPRKKGEVLEEFSQIPEAVVTILDSAGYKSMGDLFRAGTVETIMGKITLPTNESTAEIMSAWIRCLFARAQDPSASLNWQGHLPTQVALQTRQFSKEGIPKMTRRELVKQRQKLRKAKGPRGKIGIEELRIAKSRLTNVPVGKALFGKVQPDLLAQARERLRKLDL